MFHQTAPKVISEDLYTYLNKLQKITSQAVCPVFIEQLIEEVCKNVNKEKIKNYKTEIKNYDLTTEEDLKIIESKKCIVVNLKTSKELGEAYPIYLSKNNVIEDTITINNSVHLQTRDALYIDSTSTFSLLRPKCKHKEVLDLYIIQY